MVKENAIQIFFFLLISICAMEVEKVLNDSIVIEECPHVL